MDYPADDRSIYVALLDHEENTMSQLVGAFSTEDKAREACQEDATERDLPQLTWKDTQTEMVVGYSYDVVLVSLDIPTGQG